MPSRSLRSRARRLRPRRWRAEPPAPPPTLRDPEAQRRFEEDGFCVVDLLDATEVERLRAAYGSMDHRTQDESPWVSGFETSLYDPRGAYRTQVLDDVESVIGEPLGSHLVDHRIMFANYVVKLPGSDEVPPHADWTFLDEARFRSATVWVPLTDVSVELRNGPLGMVVGSQERIDFIRIANVPAYDRCVAAVEDLPRTVPSLRAGQAVVMDNRVIHFSPPNETEETRVAVGCVVGPRTADLHHYWMDEDDQLLRFTIDRSFYLDYEIGSPRGTAGIRRVDAVEDPAATPAR